MARTEGSEVTDTGANRARRVADALTNGAGRIAEDAVD